MTVFWRLSTRYVSSQPFSVLIFCNFSRFGDRFWYENGGWPSSFTVEQLNEIRKVKLSRLICDNGDEMDAMQVGKHRNYHYIIPFEMHDAIVIAPS